MKIDYDSVRFPSDSLTVRSLRKKFGEHVFEAEDQRLAEMLHWEKRCVEVGFRIAQGEQKGQIEIGSLKVREIETALQRLYVRFGVADGRETAKRHIQILQDAGKAQVTAGVGR